MGTATSIANPDGPFYSVFANGISNGGTVLLQVSLDTGFETALYAAHGGALVPMVISGDTYSSVDGGTISNSGLVAYNAEGRRPDDGRPFEGIYVTDGAETWPIDEAEYGQFL